MVIHGSFFQLAHFSEDINILFIIKCSLDCHMGPANYVNYLVIVQNGYHILSTQSNLFEGMPFCYLYLELHQGTYQWPL